MPKTILLADDSPLVGQALYSLLATEKDCELCAQAADGFEAIFSRQAVQARFSNPRPVHATNEWA